MGKLIILMTDFGLDDWFVGTMKGVIKRIYPEAEVIDLCHNIPPGDIQSGALTLLFSYKYFPSGTVFCSVVDPGVGTERKALVATDREYLFTAPDNGLLGLIAERSEVWEAYCIENKELILPVQSHTFHGRDIFAPASAYLAKGIPPSAFGTQIERFVSLSLPEPQKAGNIITGEVIYIDKFGNLITNILPALTLSGYNFESIKLTVGDTTIQGISTTFSDVQKGEPLMYIGSTGYLEIGINGGNAAQHWGLAVGSPVVIHTSEVD
ncbi:SAM-dependent chlorinase/fluorinase [Candidatus Sumerlaeota bacterium]|nr:SAM-dependent chlorinase/fluorinase [Candidatus Sumerlaeota bacterium]